jgi:hypothetical protein
MDILVFDSELSLDTRHAHEITLSEFHTLCPQDRVRRGRVKIEVRLRE